MLRSFLIFSFLTLLGSLSVIAINSSNTHKNGIILNKWDHLDSPYVLLISIDGYRYDYTEKFNPPAISKIASHGVRAKSLIPTYPTKTFATHYSMATGLYPKNHGIISNKFYDRKRDQVYNPFADRDVTTDGTWYGGTPLWVAAEHQGMRTGCHFWVGCDADIKKTKSAYHVPFDDKISHDKRINTIVDWFNQPIDIRPHLVLLYFSEVDTAGHRFGTNSDELKDAIFTVDSAIASLQERLSSLNLPINLILVSDHGMTDVTKTEFIGGYTDFSDYKTLGSSTHAYLYANETANIDQTVLELRSHAKNVIVETPNSAAKNLHFFGNQRIPDIFVEAVPPYKVSLKSRLDIDVDSLNLALKRGAHGFNPYTTNDMHSIFYAYGPNFKNNLLIPSFESIHIYPMIIELLNLELPHAIDGKRETLHEIIN